MASASRSTNAKTGRFEYLYVPETDAFIRRKSPIRDIGSIWNAEVLGGFLSRGTLRPAIEKSLRHYARYLVERDSHAVLDARRLEEPSSLAHSAFMILALPARRDLESIVALAEAILCQHRGDGSYKVYFEELPDEGEELYAGEAMLALCVRSASSSGPRTAPSAGALYPLEVYLVAGSVDGLAAGVYRYRAHGHSLRAYIAGDRRRELADAALGQTAVLEPPAVLIIAARYARTARKYGARGDRYVHIEVGHVAQNVYLQAQALGLGTVIVGAFDDAAVGAALELAESEAPLALLPVGAPR